jgi:uncharacterized membrane protein YeaQ/YmgE (transglycosylase-associated protein family)
MLWTLIVGLVVGGIAKMLMPGKDPMVLTLSLLLGVAGAFLARIIGTNFAWYHENEPAGFIASIAGAVILLGIYRFMSHRKQITHQT